MVTVRRADAFALRRNHPAWVLLQQFAVRGLVALKFFVAARLLGPEQIGLVGIALLTLAVAEALSDTGLAQAVVQTPKDVTSKDLGAVWTLQVARGLLLAAVLVCIAFPISNAFEASAAADLILLVSLLPLLRNALHPGIYLVQREQNYRAISVYEAVAAAIDFTTTVILIRLGLGVSSVLLGSVAGETIKLVLAWTWLRKPICIHFDWRRISTLAAFGKWVWGSSFITLILNQLDKVLVAKFLGAAGFGVYQVASRIAQLFVADVAVAAGNYLFPSLAHRNRAADGDPRGFTIRVFRWMAPCFVGVAGLLSIFAADAVGLLLGDQWLSAVPLIRILSFAMLCGALNAVFVAYFRAIGKPRVVTHAVLLQLAAMIVLAPSLIPQFGANGAAIAAAASILSAVILFAIKFRSRELF